VKKIRIATRASRLALAQTELVKAALERLRPQIEISVVKTSTKGDRDKSDFLYKSDSVGLFTKEVEKAVLCGKADMAVQSLKDLPTMAGRELPILAVLKRENPTDVLVASSQVSSLDSLPAGATVGTSSLRRIAQLKHWRGDLRCVPMRGNVETRIRKVEANRVGAVVVAYAGLKRLGLTERISAILPLERFLPAPGQGALAVQVCPDERQLTGLVSQLDDEPTRIATEAERTVLAAMHGGCSVPLGVHAEITNKEIVIDAMIADVDGRQLVRLSRTAAATEAKSCAEQLAKELLAAGAQQIVDGIRNRTQADE